MSGLGNCYDNAKAEAFFSTLKSECLPATQVFESKAVARRELFEYIEIYYNNKRLHSALGYQAPRQFEAEHLKKGSNFFEENVSATSSRKRNEVQESKRNKWKGPSRSVGKQSVYAGLRP
jgi:Integrase core domain